MMCDVFLFSRESKMHMWSSLDRIHMGVYLCLRFWRYLEMESVFHTQLSNVIQCNGLQWSMGPTVVFLYTIGGRPQPQALPPKKRVTFHGQSLFDVSYPWALASVTVEQMPSFLRHGRNSPGGWVHRRWALLCFTCLDLKHDPSMLWTWNIFLMPAYNIGWLWVGTRSIWSQNVVRTAFVWWMLSSGSRSQRSRLRVVPCGTFRTEALLISPAALSARQLGWWMPWNAGDSALNMGSILSISFEHFCNEAISGKIH